MDGKISFGFTKVKKQPVLTNLKNDNVEYIQCLEEQTIKIKGKEIKEEEKPLVIPMVNNSKTSAALATLQILKSTISGTDNDDRDKSKSINKTSVTEQLLTNSLPLTLEQQAANEILTDLQKQNETPIDNQELKLPLKPDELPLEGAKESTLDDYEKIPIAKFGLAVLRGMGWTEEMKNDSKFKIIDSSSVRPKGMGLGADKLSIPKPLLIKADNDEPLTIKKGACIRVIAGKYKDLYGQIESFDDDSGRVFVKLTVGTDRITVNEFLIQPVTKAEHDKYGKVINSKKFDAYNRSTEEKYNATIIKSSESPEEVKYSNTRNKSSTSDEEYRSRKHKHKSKSHRHHHHHRHLSGNRDDRKYSEHNSKTDKYNDRKYHKKHTKKSKRTRSRSSSSS